MGEDRARVERPCNVAIRSTLLACEIFSLVITPHGYIIPQANVGAFTFRMLVRLTLITKYCDLWIWYRVQERRIDRRELRSLLVSLLHKITADMKYPHA